MKTIQLFLIVVIMGLMLINTIKIIEIEKERKELKEIKVIVDNLESQLKLLTPPPEFFTLPVVRGNK